MTNVSPHKTVYTYDVYDQLVGIQIDKANDGFVDVITIMTYDALGNMLTEERTINEKPPEISAATTSPEEASTGPIGWSVETPSGVAVASPYTPSASSAAASQDQNYRKTYAYTYDHRGNVLIQEIYYGDDETEEAVITYTYGAPTCEQGHAWSSSVTSTAGPCSGGGVSL